MEIKTLLRTGNISWPQCVPDLYLPGLPRTCEEAFELALERSWGHKPEKYYYDDCEVAAVDSQPILRDAYLYQRSGAT